MATNGNASSFFDAEDVQTAVASVAVKLPDFWKSDPVMWFAQAEAQFALAKVTVDGTKYNHIIAKVDQTVLRHVSDIVADPPATGKYEAIKARLLSRFEMSPQEKLEKLLMTCDLGDMKPTHLLAKMQDLASGLKVDDNLMKMLFLNRLPPNIRPILSIHDGTLAKLAEMGDKMVDSSHTHVAATQAAAPSNDDVSEQLAYLTAEIRKLKTSSGSRSRSTSRARSTSEDRSRDLCWYHFKYGDQARQCRQPCKYSGPKN